MNFNLEILNHNIDVSGVDATEDEEEDDGNVEGSHEQEEYDHDMEGLQEQEEEEDDVEGLQKLANHEFKCLPWYERLYYVEDIHEEAIYLWKTPTIDQSLLKLPSRNEFIPKDFSVHVGGTSGEDNSTSPKCLVDEERMKVWWKQDRVFSVPQGAIYLRLHFNGAWNDPKSCVLSELFLHLLWDKLSEVTLKAQMAMGSIHAEFVAGMLELKIFGFSSVLRDLLCKVLVDIASFVPTDYDHCNLIKDDLKTSLNDEDAYLHVFLLEHHYFSAEMVDYLEDTSLLENVSGFIKEIRSKVFIECLCHGNVKKEEAFEISKIIQKSLCGNAISDGSRQVAKRVISLHPKENIALSFRSQSKMNPNSTAKIYFQIGQLKLESLKSLALLDLFEAIVADSFCTQMRNTMNYGYEVSSSKTIIQNVLGFTFVVVSDDFNPYELQNEIQGFIDNGLEKFLCDLDEPEFENQKTSQVNRKLQKLSLHEDSQFWWTNITDYRFEVDINRITSEILQKLKKKDLIEFYKTCFKSTSRDCKRVKIAIVSTKERMKEEDEKHISEIKKNLEFYK